MIVYLDSSVLLRVVLGEPHPLPIWPRITRALSSELIRVECLRTIDRARVRLGLDEPQVALRREGILEQLEGIDLMHVDSGVLERAADPFPTTLGTLDAIHLASALLARRQLADLVFATHDDELATAARSVGFEVHGAPGATRRRRTRRPT